MKKQLLTATLLAGLAVSSYAQGQLNIDNSSNPFSGSGSPTDATFGLFFTHTNGSSVYIPTTGNINLTIWTSTTGAAGSYTANATVLNAAYGGLDGTVANGNTVLTGWAVGSTPYIALQVWLGQDTSYAAAVADGSFAGQSGGATLAGWVSGGLGGVPSSGPPVTPPDISAMPAIILTGGVVPEPTTFALAGLGAASLLIFRRRK